VPRGLLWGGAAALGLLVLAVAAWRLRRGAWPAAALARLRGRVTRREGVA
jgi:hypothetical protein